MSRWLNQFQPQGIMILRVVLGFAMVVHGWPKVIPAGGFHHGNLRAALEHFAHFVAGLGLPPWLGYVSAFTEFVGGIFLVLGLLTRLVAFLVAINMLVAVGAVDVHHGYSGSEYAVALAAMAILLVVTGSGRPALDRKIGLS
jgi:putative oxidoreductase